ncbi:MAG: spermidine synthase [Nocardioidaceae bacterium]
MSEGYVAQAQSARGEVVLRRRAYDDALELRVNGVFAMDTAETTTERLLASRSLAAFRSCAPTRPATVLVGGLGLGFTLDQLLRDDLVERVLVAEIEPALVGWHRQGLVPQTATATGDGRVQLHTGDVADVVAEMPAESVDVIVLDVDNGPGFLVYDANASLYQGGFLRDCRLALTPGGVLTIWSSTPAPELAATIREVFDCCDVVSEPVVLGRRETAYHLLVGRMPERDRDRDRYRARPQAGV